MKLFGIGMKFLVSYRWQKSEVDVEEFHRRNLGSSVCHLHHHCIQLYIKVIDIELFLIIFQIVTVLNDIL